VLDLVNYNPIINTVQPHLAYWVRPAVKGVVMEQANPACYSSAL